MRKVAARDARGRVLHGAGASRDGRTLVPTLSEQPRDDRARDAVVIHEQDVHLVGGGARHGRPTSLADVTAPPTAFPRVSRNHPPATEPRAGVPGAFAHFAGRADRARVGARSVAPTARLAIHCPRRESVVKSVRELSDAAHRREVYPADARRRKKAHFGDPRRHSGLSRRSTNVKNIEC